MRTQAGRIKTAAGVYIFRDEVGSSGHFYCCKGELHTVERLLFPSGPSFCSGRPSGSAPAAAEYRGPRHGAKQGAWTPESLAGQCRFAWRATHGRCPP